MPVDPQIQILLDKGTGVPATHTLSVPEARAQYEARVALMAPPAAVAKVDERRIAAARDWAFSAAGVFPRQRLCVVQPGYA
jgi:hypothetical protein